MTTPLEKFHLLNPGIALEEPKPLPDLSSWVQEQKVGEVNVVQGAGRGLYSYFQGQTLLLFEKDLGKLAAYLATEEGASHVNDPKGFVFYDCAHARKLAAFAFAKKQLNILTVPGEEEGKFAFFAAEVKQVCHEFFEGGAVFYRSFYKNLDVLPSAYSGSALFGKFRGCTALVVGAGPSLNAQLPQITKRKEKVLLIAGGSALNVLESAGIAPHFSVGVDPNPLQKKRLEKQSFTAPFFFRGRIHFEALEAVAGPKLFLPGAGGYPAAEWFEKELRIFGEVLDEGHNVVNLSVSLARSLGCEEIVLAGVDLAYSDLSSYAKGVVTDPSLTVQQIETVGGYEERGFTRPAISGGEVYTTWKWLAEAKWLEEFQEKHPEIALKNATAKGLLIKGLETVSLDALAGNSVPKVPELTPLRVSETEVSVAKKTLFSSLQRVEVALQEMATAEGDSTEYILALSDLEEEIAWEIILEPLAKVWDLHDELPRLLGKSQEEERIQFLLGAAKLNAQLLDL